MAARRLCHVDGSEAGIARDKDVAIGEDFSARDFPGVVADTLS
jgi:hypothetical protein